MSGSFFPLLHLMFPSHLCPHNDTSLSSLTVRPDMRDCSAGYKAKVLFSKFSLLSCLRIAFKAFEERRFEWQVSPALSKHADWHALLFTAPAHERTRSLSCKCSCFRPLSKISLTLNRKWSARMSKHSRFVTIQYCCCGPLVREHGHWNG